MHYHLEVIIPPTDDVEKSVKEVMARFDENGDDGPGFWDWYVIGGRWAGYKSELSLDQEALATFRQWLTDEKVMVKGVQFGKQELSDSETTAKVDAKWRELFPGAGEQCTLFAHSNDQYREWLPGDVLRLGDLPVGLTAERVIFARANDDGTVEAEHMLHRDFWNGVSHVKTAWDGTFASALDEYREGLRKCRAEYAQKHNPTDDWLAVTVDYHS